MKYLAPLFALIIALVPFSGAHAQAAPSFGSAIATFGTFSGAYGAQVTGNVVAPPWMPPTMFIVAVAVLEEAVSDPSDYAGSYYELFDENDFTFNAGSYIFSRVIPDMNGTPFIANEDYFFIFKLASTADPAAFAPMYATSTTNAVGAPNTGNPPGPNPNPGPNDNNDTNTTTTTSVIGGYTFNTIKNPLCEGSDNPACQEFDVMMFLQKLFSNLVKIAIPILVLFIIYSGFKFVEAQGNEKKIEEARKIFTSVIIGGVVILAAWTIAMAIKGTINNLEASLPFIIKLFA